MGSGFTTFTAGNVLTASEVNNYLMEQSVMFFETTGARDSAITAPEAGMTAYINSGDSSEGLYSYTGTTWNKGPSWNAPWGVLGFQTTTTAFSTSATHTTYQDSGLTLSIPYVTNRYLRVTWQGNPYTPGGVQGIGFKFLRGATIIQEGAIPGEAMAAGVSSAFITEIIVATTSTTTETFKLQIKAWTNNTAVADFASSPATSRQFIVEDIGPSGAPN